MPRSSTPSGPSPAERLGLPEDGPGSLAGLGRRIGALLIDWAASMIVALGLFGVDVIRGGGWRQWMTMAVFFVESALLTAFVGGSFGQLVSKLRIRRLADPERPVGPVALLRQLMVCLVIPAIVSGPDGRGLHDVVSGTVLVNK